MTSSGSKYICFYCPVLRVSSSWVPSLISPPAKLYFWWWPQYGVKYKKCKPCRAKDTANTAERRKRKREGETPVSEQGQAWRLLYDLGLPQITLTRMFQVAAREPVLRKTHRRSHISSNILTSHLGYHDMQRQWESSERSPKQISLSRSRLCGKIHTTCRPFGQCGNDHTGYLEDYGLPIYVSRMMKVILNMSLTLEKSPQPPIL